MFVCNYLFRPKTCHEFRKEGTEDQRQTKVGAMAQWLDTRLTIERSWFRIPLRSLGNFGNLFYPALLSVFRRRH